MTRALRRWWRSTTAIALFFDLRIALRRVAKARGRVGAAVVAFDRETERTRRISRYGAVHALFTLHGIGR